MEIESTRVGAGGKLVREEGGGRAADGVVFGVGEVVGVGAVELVGRVGAGGAVGDFARLRKKFSELLIVMAEGGVLGSQSVENELNFRVWRTVRRELEGRTG